MRTLSRLDRRLGEEFRGAVAGIPRGPAVARGIAGSMSPGFRVVVAVLIVLPRRRAGGLRALAAGVAGAMVARALRDAVGRARPGPRGEGGFPSRHAAAAAAITASLWTREPRLARALAVAAALGSAARVADAEHEPGDVLAGAALGLLIAAPLQKPQA